MKTKFFKILAPIVALGLLIGALVGVSASANEAAPAADTTPEIISMNVEYGSELYLYFAVDAKTVSGAPSLEILDGEGNVIEAVTDYTTATIWGGTQVYVLKAPGTAPKDINVKVNVRAADGDAKGAVKSVCIEDYFYAKLYKEGYALKTEADSADYTRRNLYFQLLKYANAAQDLFCTGDYEVIGAPALAVEGAEGLSSGKYAGTSDVIALNAANKEGFSYWKVVEFTPFGKVVGTRLLGDGYEVCFAGNSIGITPVYNAESMDGVEAWDAGLVHFNTMPGASIYETTSAWESAYNNNNSLIGTNTWNIVTLEDGNRVLKIDKDCQGKFADGSSKVYTCGVNNRIMVTEKQDGANVAVFETQILFDKLTATSGIQIHFYAGTDTAELQPLRFYLPVSGVAKGAVIKYQDYNAGGADKNHPMYDQAMPGAVVGSWFTLRIEYRTVEKDGKVVAETKTYINGTLVATSNNMYGTQYTSGSVAVPAASAITKVTFAFNNDFLGDMYVDDCGLKLVKE